MTSNPVSLIDKKISQTLVVAGLKIMQFCVKTSWKNLQSHRLMVTALLITITVSGRLDELIML